MTDATAEELEPPKKSKLPLILGLVAALVGGGGGFFAAFSGMIMPDDVPTEVVAEEEFVPTPLPDVSYISLEPMTISIGPIADRRHLRFRAEIEVPKAYQSDVESILPRIVDVLNGFLRVLTIEDLEKNTAIYAVKSQMLQRLDLVAGHGRINDLLIMEFVLN